MRTFLGMVLGALLTVTAAYAYDGYALRNDPAARQMVNWDVVRANWDGVQTSVREMGSRVHDEWIKVSG